jgi:hypothetical protein
MGTRDTASRSLDDGAIARRARLRVLRSPNGQRARRPRIVLGVKR